MHSKNDVRLRLVYGHRDLARGKVRIGGTRSNMRFSRASKSSSELMVTAGETAGSRLFFPMPALDADMTFSFAMSPIMHRATGTSKDPAGANPE
jgi:hypothetical protein